MFQFTETNMLWAIGVAGLCVLMFVAIVHFYGRDDKKPHK